MRPLEAVRSERCRRQARHQKLAALTQERILVTREMTKRTAELFGRIAKPYPFQNSRDPRPVLATDQAKLCRKAGRTPDDPHQLAELGSHITVAPP